MAANPHTHFYPYYIHTRSVAINISYWLITTKQSATDSEQLCNNDGGTLAYIPDPMALTEVTHMRTDYG